MSLPRSALTIDFTNVYVWCVSVGRSRCCFSLSEQTRLHFLPAAEIRDHRGSTGACLTWHFLVRGCRDSFTPLWLNCHMSTLRVMAFVSSVLSDFFSSCFFVGTLLYLQLCI